MFKLGQLHKNCKQYLLREGRLLLKVVTGEWIEQKVSPKLLVKKQQTFFTGWEISFLLVNPVKKNPDFKENSNVEHPRWVKLDTLGPLTMSKKYKRNYIV